jgi:regulator of sigma E protease
VTPVDFIPQFGNLLYTLIAFVAALSVIVAIHEYGHYIVGRWSGIRAEVFSLGFGPVIWSRLDKRGTQWQIAAIPLGGYVKFLGDANAASAKADEATMAALSPEERRHTIHGAPLWARAATVAAGPVFNFILSLVIFAGFSMAYGVATQEPTVERVYTLPSGPGDIRPGDRILAVDGVPTPDYTALSALMDGGPESATRAYRVLRDGTEITVTGPALMPGRVSGVQPGSAAQEAGLRRDDVIVSVNGAPLLVFDQLRQAVAKSGGQPVALEVWREGAVQQVTLTPKSTDDLKADGSFETRYMIGVAADMFFEPLTRTAGPAESLGIAAGQVKFVMTSSLNGLWHVVTGAISSCNVRGPVTIAKTSAAAASAGLKDFIWFIAAMSTAIGLLNLFPIPMLDGGHLVFNLIEWATGHAPSGRLLNALMVMGLFVVLSFMAFGLTNDFLCP